MQNIVSEPSLGVLGESKVRNLNVEMGIEQNVLRFDVPVRKLLFGEVLKSSHHLLSVESADISAETTLL
jgi:hypothetical protein